MEIIPSNRSNNSKELRKYRRCFAGAGSWLSRTDISHLGAVSYLPSTQMILEEAVQHVNHLLADLLDAHIRRALCEPSIHQADDIRNAWVGA